jgi:hypothetical protein
MISVTPPSTKKSEETTEKAKISRTRSVPEVSLIPTPVSYDLRKETKNEISLLFIFNFN